MVHENAPHDASGNGQEMRAVLPGNIGIDQAQVGFIDERRRLQAVPGTLSGHAPSRDLLKLPLYKRDQSVEGSRIALTPFQKQCGGLRGIVRNVAILSLFAWFTVSRPVSLSALLQLNAACPVTAFTLFPQFPAFQAARNFVPSRLPGFQRGDT